jgi:hypothetical protein
MSARSCGRRRSDDSQCDASRQEIDRFKSIGRGGAILILVALAAMIVYGIVRGAHLPGANGGPPGTDSALFFRIIGDLRAGRPYYEAITRAQRVYQYPLRPFLAVRLPTLAVAMAAFPVEAARYGAIASLAFVTLLTWLWRLRAQMSRPISFSLTVLLLAGSAFPAFIRSGYTLHELWSGALIALSLALYQPRRWPLSFLIGLLALSIRELSAGYFLAMGALAFRDGRREEALAWSLGLLAFLAGLALHAYCLRPYVQPQDSVSPGWLGLAGWRFVLLQMKWNALLMTTPDWMAAVLAPVAVLGLAARAGALNDRLLLVVVGYGAGFLIVGRPDNSYWGLMIAPLWPIGIVWAWPALRELMGKAFGGLRWPQLGGLSGAP